MADIRVKDLNEAAAPGADYFLLTDSATDGVKKVKTSNIVKPSDIGAATAAQGVKADTAVQPGDLATVATSGAYSDLMGKPTLGTAAALNTGTAAGDVVALDGSGKLPAIDGSQLTGLPGGGDILAANNGSDFDDKQATALNLGAAIFNSASAASTATIPSGVNTLMAGGQPYVKVLDQNAPGLGANIILDPGFDTGTGWTAETGWTISSGSAARTNTGTITRVYYSAVAPIVGQAYLVAVDVPSITSGKCLLQIGQTNSADISVAGTYYFVLTASNTNYFSVFGRETFAGYVDNLVARPLPVGAFQSADGAWWVPFRTDGRLNAKWFGAKGDGVTDDTVALWNAIAAVSYGFGHTVFIPAGRYKVTSTLGYTNTSPGTAGIAIEGEDPTTSVLVYSGTGDCISFNMGTNTYRTTNRVAVRRLGICAAASKPADEGAAISVARGAASSIVPGNLFEDVHIWQEDGTRWLYGIYTSNSTEQYFNRLYIMLVNNELGAAIRIANSTTQSSFGAFLNDCSINGGGKGLWVTGWVETVKIEGGIIAGQIYPVFLDATGTPLGDPHFAVTNCHLNGKTTTIYTAKWRSIFLSNADIYSGVGSGDTDGNNVEISDAKYVHVTGCKLDIGGTGHARGGVLLNNVEGFLFTGNNFVNISATGLGVTGSGSKRGVIVGNNFAGDVDGTPNDNGVYINGVSSDGIFLVNSNTFDYFATPVTLAANNSTAIGNVAVNCTNSYSVSGTGTITANNVG